jgi:hypothetical protein
MHIVRYKMSADKKDIHPMRNSRKLGLAGLVLGAAASLFSGGCRTSVMLGYEGNGSRIVVPVYDSAAMPESGRVADNLAAGHKDQSGKFWSWMNALLLGYGTANVARNHWVEDDGAAAGIGLATGLLYGCTRHNKEANWFDWTVFAAGAYGALETKHGADAVTPAGLGGYDPNQGTDGGTGDDGDQDTGNW